MTWCSSTGQTSTTASLLEQQFQERGIAYRMDPFSGGRISYLYEGDVMPTDKQVLVRWGDYDAAKEISSQVKLQGGERAGRGRWGRV